MARAEITRKLEDIVEFAEMAKFIDTPVKRYSSGMNARLAFSVAAHLDTDILFVDEVLAVGDQAFQEKCLTKMDSVSRAGRTVLFVSHQQGMLAKLCTRAIVLRSGQIIHEGDVADSFVAYADAIRADKAAHAGTTLGPLAEAVELRVAELAGKKAVWGAAVDPLHSLPMRVVIGLTEPVKGCGIRIDVKKGGVHLFSLKPLSGQEVDAEASLEMRAVLPAGLLSPGGYDLDLWVYGQGYGRWACVRSFASFDVVARWTNDYVPNEAMGVLNINAPVHLVADAMVRA
jgi:lipopolysaccharide transport system ATP-binding protein